MVFHVTHTRVIYFRPYLFFLSNESNLDEIFYHFSSSSNIQCSRESTKCDYFLFISEHLDDDFVDPKKGHMRKISLFTCLSQVKKHFLCV